MDENQPSQQVRFWWVNQGQTYEKAKAAGFIWAPKVDKSGATPFYWENVNRVQAGNIIFNYADSFVRAVSVVKAAPYEAERGSLEGNWDTAGWRADLDYYELPDPVPISRIGSQIRDLQLVKGPINRDGRVNQGYLFEVDARAANIIAAEAGPDNLPVAIRRAFGQLPSSATPSHWIFQGNPDNFDVDQYLRTRSEIFWQVRQHGDRIKPGDKVLIWRSGKEGGVVAECIAEAEPSMEYPVDAPELYRIQLQDSVSYPSCKLQVLARYTDAPISRERIKELLPDLNIIITPRATNFPLTQAQYATILSLKNQRAASPFPALLRRYKEEQILFTSSAEQRRYAITAWDESGVEVSRLDANEPQRITFAQAERLISQVQAAGRMDFTSLHYTAAVRNTILQAEPLALTADRAQIAFLQDPSLRLQNFLEVLDKLNRAEKNYKPAMLLCVVEGIESHELTKNRIPFDWIAPHFVEKMRLLGKSVTQEQAAWPFYHLANDHIWLHAVPTFQNLMQSGSEGASAASTKIKYALLKDTYWNLLQDPASRDAVHTKLESLLVRETPEINPEILLSEAEAAIRLTHFIQPAGQTRRLLSALISKPFVILTGNSGTGKTQLAQLIAQWLAGTEDDSRNGYAVVPVGADWTDNRNIVGFANHLRKDGDGNPIYQSTPVLDLLLRAQADSQRPYFLILDEMNLSHVERYFADFLSAMESKKTIPLHSEKQALKTASGQDVPQSVSFPPNLFVIGTVNVDETTYMFSPKVLDRANVLEFRIGPEDTRNFLKQSGGPVGRIKVAPPGRAEVFLLLSLQARGLKTPGLKPLDTKSRDECHKTLEEVFELLHRARLEFAFRTIAEVLRYLQVEFTLASDKQVWKWEESLDAQILQKVLPKLHGSRRRLEAVLVALATYCETHDKAAAKQRLNTADDLSGYPPAAAPGNVFFPLSHSKLLEMLEAVRRDQFVSFIQ